MYRARATLALVVAWVAGCAPPPTNGAGTGGTTGATATSGTSGSSGGMCTSEGGVSNFTGPLVGACVLLNSTCGDAACIDYLGMLYQDIGQKPCQGDPNKQWFDGDTCNRVVPNLKGGCEIVSSPYQATDVWYSSAGTGDCWSCDVCGANGSACLVGYPDFTECTQEMPTTGSAGSTGGSGTAGSSGGGASSSSSSGGVSCVATLTGGPIATEVNYACTATQTNVSAQVVGLLLSATGGRDGGWGADKVELEYPAPNFVLAPGTYSSTMAGSWTADFIAPDGTPYRSGSDGGGSATFNITGYDMYSDMGGTATVAVPMCSASAPGCDGGVITAQYVFSE